ncbi:hypothetical protein HK102_004543, partial [Quaeritorhiza haematococci]
ISSSSMSVRRTSLGGDGTPRSALKKGLKPRGVQSKLKLPAQRRLAREMKQQSAELNVEVTIEVPPDHGVLLPSPSAAPGDDIDMGGTEKEDRSMVGMDEKDNDRSGDTTMGTDSVEMNTANSTAANSPEKRQASRNQSDVSAPNSATKRRMSLGASGSTRDLPEPTRRNRGNSLGGMGSPSKAGITNTNLGSGTRKKSIGGGIGSSGVFSFGAGAAKPWISSPISSSSVTSSPSPATHVPTTTSTSLASTPSEAHQSRISSRVEGGMYARPQAQPHTSSRMQSLSPPKRKSDRYEPPTGGESRAKFSRTGGHGFGYVGVGLSGAGAGVGGGSGSGSAGLSSLSAGGGSRLPTFGGMGLHHGIVPKRVPTVKKPASSSDVSQGPASTTISSMTSIPTFGHRPAFGSGSISGLTRSATSTSISSVGSSGSSVSSSSSSTLAGSTSSSSTASSRLIAPKKFSMSSRLKMGSGVSAGGGGGGMTAAGASGGTVGIGGLVGRQSHRVGMGSMSSSSSSSSVGSLGGFGLRKPSK